MENGERRARLWRFLCRLLGPAIRYRAGLEMERLPEGKAAVVVCNHVTNFDPVFLALASPTRPLTYVASEHILRDRPMLRKLLYALFDPIPRRKAASAVDTCRKTVRALRDGKTVVLFAEGETTWNGRTAPLQRGTAVLVKAAGAPLITYRFHGGYLAAPRWGKGLRRGKITGRVTGKWTAEQLKAMSTDEVSALIEEGIREDAFAAQHRERVTYHTRRGNRLRQIEALLFLCPQCRQIGTLRGEGDRIRCACGLCVRADECLLLEAGALFPGFTAWDDWQTATLRQMARENGTMELHECREGLRMMEIMPDQSCRQVAAGRLGMNRERMCIGSWELKLADIREMATLQNRKLAISTREHYYELQAAKACCLRKYLLLWHFFREESDQTAGEGT